MDTYIGYTVKINVDRGHQRILCSAYLCGGKEKKTRLWKKERIPTVFEIFYFKYLTICNMFKY